MSRSQHRRAADCFWLHLDLLMVHLVPLPKGGSLSPISWQLTLHVRLARQCVSTGEEVSSAWVLPCFQGWGEGVEPLEHDSFLVMRPRGTLSFCHSQWLMEERHSASAWDGTCTRGPQARRLGLSPGTGLPVCPVSRWKFPDFDLPWVASRQDSD